MQHKQIKAIQALRGIAALLVCVMHIVSNQQSSDPWIVFSKHVMQSIGHFGVDLFFTISGFIITWIVMKETTLFSIKSGLSFIIKRFFRIYPLFWFTLFFMFWLSIFNNGFINDEAHKVFTYPVILLLTPSIPLQYSAWTLCFELYFYGIVLIFICFFQRKYFLHFFTVWGILQFLVIILNDHHFLKETLSFFGSYQIFEFYFGLLIGYFLYHYNKYAADKYMAMIVGLILCSLYSYITYKEIQISNWLVFLLQAGSASLLIYGSVGLEQHNKLKASKILQKLGDMSYSIYLWGFPMLGIVTHINNEFVYWGQMQPFFQICVTIAMVIVISSISNRWIERSFIQFSRKLISFF